LTVSRQLIFTALTDIPLIKANDNLSEIIAESCFVQRLQIEDGDVFVLAQKIVSKAENRLVDLRSIHPGLKAKRLATRIKKDPRLIELILSESKRIIRIRKGLIIVEHKNGFVCANAGIDHSNSIGGTDAESFVLLLPKDADNSARLIRESLERRFEKQLGVMIIDSHGRAWRNGTVGTCIGLSGIPGQVDLRGKPDLFGYQLKATIIGAADELAGGSSLLMGQASEGSPIIHVRGFPYELRESSLGELIRPKELDLFR
jgi:coenzyme F420-0:L-glutamate ligase / coenzyme F420-1:gamma-L-glutamate ligase